MGGAISALSTNYSGTLLLNLLTARPRPVQRSGFPLWPRTHLLMDPSFKAACPPW